MFAWLVGRKRILTWDQIQKRGFLGPPRCSLCDQNGEDQEHILNGCPVAQFQWEETRCFFGKSNCDPLDIIQTLFQWGKGQFQSPVIRRAWNLVMGFNIWNIWKERNRRIFQGKRSKPEDLSKRTQNQIRETILSETWDQEDWKTSEEENHILRKLNLEPEMVFPNHKKTQVIKNQSPVVFTCPQEGFIKLNFDRASKGNLGPSGYGGIFRDSQGQTRWIYADRGGLMSNNESEFMAVYQGIRIAIRNGYMKLDIEGDSNLVIETIRKLNHGKSLEQVAKSWRTVGLIQDLEESMKRIEYKVIHHVRREGNKPADYLANWGCNEPEGKVDTIWTPQMARTRWENLNRITNQDNNEAILP